MLDIFYVQHIFYPNNLQDCSYKQSRKQCVPRAELDLHWFQNGSVHYKLNDRVDHHTWYEVIYLLNVKMGSKILTEYQNGK